MRVGARQLLSPASFRVGPGDKVGLVGRNGAGKTTLTKILAGEGLPASGSVTKSGEIGYLPQDPRTGDLDVLARDRILSALQSDVDELAERAVARMPEEIPAYRGRDAAFFADVREVYMHGLLEYFRWRDTERLNRFRALTVRGALDRHFRSEKLQLVLAGDCGHWGSPPRRSRRIRQAGRAERSCRGGSPCDQTRRACSRGQRLPPRWRDQPGPNRGRHG